MVRAERRCAAAPASPTTSGSRSTAATASRRRSIRRTRASSTPSRRTATSRASTRSATSASRSARCRRAAKPPLRWNWNTPILMSPHDPATIYVGANKVFKSTDRGQSWTAISPDLTEATDRDGLPLMGVTGKEITIAKNDGVQSVRQHRAAGRIAEERRRALRRHRRRQGPHDQGRQDLDRHHQPVQGRAEERVCVAADGRRRTTSTSSTRPSTTTAPTT